MARPSPLREAIGTVSIPIPQAVTRASPSRRPILLVVNPVSGGKLGSGPGLSDDVDALQPQALEAALEARGLTVNLHELVESDDLVKLTREAARDGHDVVIAGGDGTVGKVAAALVGTDATLGILAMGSYNNVAHGFRVPTDLEPALDVISAGKVALMDAGRVKGTGADEELFFEAAGVGLDAIGFKAVEIVERHGWGAAWHAIRTAVRGLRKRKTAIRLTLDGTRYRTRSPLVSVCNGPYHGLGFALSPRADPTDGELDVAIFNRMTVFQILGHFLAVARHKVEHEPRIRHRRAKEIRVDAVRGALPVHADGVSAGTTPVTISVQPDALRIFR